MSVLPPGIGDLREAADAYEAEGRLLAAIDALTLANRGRADPAVEARLARLRHAAFVGLDRTPGFATWPPTVTAPAPETVGSVPEVGPADVTAELLRATITAHGCLLVRGLAGPSQVARFVDGIERALEASAGPATPGGDGSQSAWHRPLPLDDPVAKASLGRKWVRSGGGLLTADSPRMLFLLLEAFEAAGLREVVAGYLGERPVLSANKCTLRRVQVDTNAGWHQDGAFLGPGIRALNIWLALSPCGRDAPGLDLVPRRLDHLAETGTGGSYFDWAVGPEVVRELARDTPVVRPLFEPGDALLFDDLFLHQTGIDAGMTKHRYAIETWCFAPSAYPDGQVPLVW